jgi:mRNA interferase HicA
MKRVELLRRVARMARSRGVAWRLDRQGANHEVWRCGSVEVTVPRHREINEITAIGILTSLEEALGKGWWRS